MKTNATKLQLENALNFVNQKFDDNVQFKEIKQISSKRINFTLRVKNSSGPGAKIGYSGRKTIAACWHVHGYFFEYLFLLYPEIFIISQGKKMIDNSNNWIDQNVGKNYNPVSYSSLCNCK
jgi:hypothetical protein